MPMVITRGAASAKAFGWSGGAKAVTGQQAYTTAGTYSWVAPVGVTKVSVVAIGAGGAGGAGALAYRNNKTVVPGCSYAIRVGLGRSSPSCGGVTSNSIITWCACPTAGFTRGTSSVGSTGGLLSCSGQYCGGGSGGNGSYGGGGAGGYAGTGGNGRCPPFNTAGAGGGGGGGGTSSYGGPPGDQSLLGYGGGGTGILGQGANGAAGAGASLTGKGGSGGADGNTTCAPCSGGTGGLYGGAGGQGLICTCWCAGCNSYTAHTLYNHSGAGGAVRIIWPGCARAFPSTRTGNE